MAPLRREWRDDSDYIRSDQEARSHLEDCISMALRGESRRKEKRSPTCQEGTLAGKLHTFEKLYGAASSQTEKKKLLRNFEERKEQALNSGRVQSSKKSAWAPRMQRSWYPSLPGLNAENARPDGGQKRQIPERPQTAFGFAGVAGMHGKLQKKGRAPWQGDAVATASWSRTERSWDSGLHGEVSSLGVCSEGSCQTRSSVSRVQEIDSGSDGTSGSELEGRNDLWRDEEDKEGCKRDKADLEAEMDVTRQASNRSKGFSDIPESGGIRQGGLEFSKGDVVDSLECSESGFGRETGPDADCDVVIEELCSALAAVYADQESAVSSTWFDLRPASASYEETSESGVPTSQPSEYSNLKAPSGFTSSINREQLRTDSVALLSESEGEDSSGAIGTWGSGASGEVTQIEDASGPPQLRFETRSQQTNSQVSFEDASQPNQSDRLRFKLSSQSLRPQSSIPTLRPARTPGLISSTSLSAESWPKLPERSKRAFSAPSSRSASPSMQGASRLEVRTRVAFSKEQFVFYHEGVPVPRPRMIPKPEMVKTTVQQLKEWRQSERVQAWWYRHQKTVLYQRKLRLRKAASDVKWIQERRRKEKAWHRAMRDEVLRRALAAERIKLAFQTVLAMVKTGRRGHHWTSSVTLTPSELRSQSGKRQSSHHKELGPNQRLPRASKGPGEEGSGSKGGGEPERTTNCKQEGLASEAPTTSGTQAESSSGGEQRVLTKSVSRPPASSPLGDKVGAAKKKSVGFGGMAGPDQRAPGRGKVLAGRGLEDQRESSSHTPPEETPTKKGGGKAGWLVPVYKSKNFVPMFEVPQEGPLLTSRRPRLVLKSPLPSASSGSGS